MRLWMSITAGAARRVLPTDGRFDGYRQLLSRAPFIGVEMFAQLRIDCGVSDPLSGRLCATANDCRFNEHQACHRQPTSVSQCESPCESLNAASVNQFTRAPSR